MGYAARPVPQNVSGSFESHAQCGANCTLGCRVDDGTKEKGKRSGCKGFLGPLATAKDKDGLVTRIITDFEVDKIVWDEKNAERAIGAIGWSGAERKRVFIRAKVTVLASGTLQSPAILLRSGLLVCLLLKHSRSHRHLNRVQC